MASVINPSEPSEYKDERVGQTVEVRSPDGSALFYLLLAGLTVSADYGLTSEGTLELTRKTHTRGNFFDDKALLDQFEPLPVSCAACSRLLHERRSMYQELGVFPASIIDHVVQLLAKENDMHLSRDLSRMSAEERLAATRHLTHRKIHTNHEI